MNYQEELNESQQRAVFYNDGPSLVIAGAGSGKTRVLTYKIAYLLEQGYEPWRILALTFTNKAAKEMKERIAAQVGERRARYLWMGTFHSMFLRILRTEASLLNFSPNFTIYDQADSRSLVKSILKEMDLDEKVYKPNVVQGRISGAKNRLISPQEYAANGELFLSDQEAKIPAVREVYARYWDRCRQADAMDFDDLLFYTYLLFDRHPEVRKKYAEQFAYVLVDEYQDTNFAQHTIVWQLTQEQQRLCVVGDDAQSIYSFRGANIDYILGFTRRYTDARVFKLEQNYRSTQTIVEAANSLINKNSEQIHKEVYSKNEVGDPLKVYEAYSDVEEGDIVARQIRELKLQESLSLNDFAVLYRTNAQSRIFEEALRKNSLAYRVYGGLSFYQRKEIKDVIAYFRLAVNPNDEEAFKRVVNYPARGIGDTTVGKILVAATEAHVSLWRVISHPEEFQLAFNQGTLRKLAAFQGLVAQFMEDAPSVNAYELGERIIKESGIYSDIRQDHTPEDLSRQENVDELLGGIHDFCAMREEEGNENTFLSDYLSNVALLTDQDSDDAEVQERVTLMTVHAAKGLEFNTVFVVGLEEQLFPSVMAYDNPRQMEEERRLLYVAITRAEKHCLLSYAKSRFRYGKLEFGTPSLFLKDIDPQYLQMPKKKVRQEPRESLRSRFSDDLDFGHARSFERPFNQERPAAQNHPVMNERQPSLPERTVNKPVVQPAFRRLTPLDSRTSTPVSATAPKGAAVVAKLVPGQLIEHERFGIGEVVRVEGSGDNCKALIRFENAGEKQLLLKFARFRVLPEK